MLAAEAKWIGDTLGSLPVNAISPCLNLGSSTAAFRTEVQSYIQQHLIAPNEARGVRFIHADLKKAPGVDVAGDVFDPAYQAELAALRPASILCCNLFEHVRDRLELARICRRIVGPGGHLIVSVPYSFPYHVDPIDTYFRPEPAALAALFPDCTTVAADVVADTSYWEELAQLGLGRRLLTLGKVLLHLPLPFYRWNIWAGKMHRLLWLARPYRVSIVVLRC
jgi:SAM-dependent methyltransferase